MCGIVGVMSEKLSLGDYLKFKDLFTLAQLRGDDGAGIATVPMKAVVDKVRVRKTTWSSGHLVTTADYDEAIKGDNSILIGHARQPTKGASKIENVHPHSCDGITLVHNGTMNHVDNSTIKADESDSKLICKTIAAKGAKHFVDNSSGAYCLVWTNLHDQTLNFLRNSSRPLYIMEIKQSIHSSLITHVWWASELWMLYQALSRISGVLNKDLINAYSLPVDQLTTYPLSVEPWIKAPTTEKMEKVYTYNHQNYGYFDGWEDWENQDPTKGDTGSRSVVPFQGGSSGSSGNSGGSSGSGTESKPFTYIPPEHRQARNDDSATTAIISAGRILERSKQDAELNAATAAKKVKEVVAKATAGFRCDSLDKYAATHKKALELVSQGCCIWCEEKPLIIQGQDLKVFPVRFAVDRTDYACSTCIQDADIQRMVGIG